jgi:heterotetrameric sarcosine oxidase delta subunit
MSFLLPCPNCGRRDVGEFTCAGEVTTRPRGSPSHQELARYLYFRGNVAGVQREWWYHRDGCEQWFIAARDTRTNQVLITAPAAPARGGAAGPEQPDVAEPPAT